jgi:hypothetical protein
MDDSMICSVSRPPPAFNYARYRRVDVCARDTSGNVHGDHHCKGPTEGYCVPVITLWGQTRGRSKVRDDAITEEDQDESPKDLTNELSHQAILFHRLFSFS